MIPDIKKNAALLKAQMDDYIKSNRKLQAENENLRGNNDEQILYLQQELETRQRDLDALSLKSQEQF